MASQHRFDRNEQLFGQEGQRALRKARVAVVGVGGLGTHVVQQLAFLGIGALNLIDHEELSGTNRNRYVGSRHDDPVSGFLKVDLGERLAMEIDNEIEVRKVPEAFPSEASLEALQAADAVFGCVDNDGIRFVLNESCQAYEKPLFDLASDIPEEGRYGGRIIVVNRERGCLYCRDVLNQDEVRRFLSSQGVLDNEDAVYGIHRKMLGESGPSVVSLNGTVASLGVTEFMVWATDMRAPKQHLTYRGDMGTVSYNRDDPPSDCYYCKNIRGQGAAANIARYFR